MDDIKVGSRNFWYSGSIIQDNEKLIEDITTRINARWVKQKGASGVLCNRRIPLKLKDKFYRTVLSQL